MSPVNVLCAELQCVDLRAMLDPETLSQVDPDELGEYMTWVNSVLSGETALLPGDQPIPYILKG